MTASALFADFCQKGVRLRLSEDRLRILIPKEALTPDLRETVLALKPQLISLIELGERYRRLLRQAFNGSITGGSISGGRVNGGSTKGDTASAQRRWFADEQARLLDELGPNLAAAIVTMEVRAWREETGSCPTCDAHAPCRECAREAQA